MQRIKCLKKTFQELTQGPNCWLCPSNSCRESNALRRHSRTVHVERKVEVMCAERYLFMFLLQYGLGATLLFFFIMEGHHPPSMQCLPAPAAFLRLCISASLDKLSAVVDCSLVDCCGLLCTLVDRCGLLWTVVHPCDVNHSMRRRETPRDFKHSQILRESRAIDRKNL